MGELPPELVTRWEAYDEVEPIGVNRLYELLSKIGGALFWSQGHDCDSEKFIPWQAAAKRETTAEDDIAACRMAVSNQIGAA